MPSVVSRPLRTISSIFFVSIGTGSSGADGHRFLQKVLTDKRSKFTEFLKRQAPIEVFSNPSYGTGGEACCACFHARKRTPKRFGLDATFAGTLTCDTCYVADVHDLDAVDKIMGGVAKAGSVGDGSSKFDSVQGARGVIFDPTVKDLDGCKSACEANPDCGTFAFFDKDLECHIIKPKEAMPAIWESATENKFQSFFPGIRYYPSGGAIPADPTTAFNIVQASKQFAVSEWNWSCAAGVAPTNPAAWQSPMVDGEPPSRDVYHLCEEKKYFCPGDGDEEDLMVGYTGLPHSNTAHWDTNALGDTDPYAIEGMLPKVSQPWVPDEK